MRKVRLGLGVDLPSGLLKQGLIEAAIPHFAGQIADCGKVAAGA